MIERALKNYLLSVSVIKHAVGGVYAGRIPSEEKSSEVIVLRNLSTERSYHLGGESKFVSKIIQIDIHSTRDRSSATLFAIFENIRKALNVYAAQPGTMDDIDVRSIQIVSDGVELNTSSVGTVWKRQRSFDIEIIHAQETEFVT